MRFRLLLALASLLVGASLAHAVGACDAGDPASPRLAAPPSATGAPPPVSAEAGAGDAAVVAPAGDRLLGLATERTSTTYPEDLRAARDAGAELTTVRVAWDEVERPFDAGDGDASATTIYEPTLHIAGLVAPAASVRAVLELDVVDDTGRRGPGDLAAVPLDDPAFVARWTRAQAYVLDQTRELGVTGYVIGARVDRALGEAPDAYASFVAFFAKAAAAARAARPGLAVGFAVSPSAFGARASDLAPAWVASDFVAVRLDPGAGDGGLPSPQAAAEAVATAAVAAPGNRPVFVLGAGYPGSEDAGSSPAGQRAFVRATFAAWDRSADRAPVLVFEALGPAGFEAFREEARARGF